MVFPRAMGIPHPIIATWRRVQGYPIRVEIISKEQCVLYGAAAVCIGLAVLWSATMRGPDVPRNDRAIADSILLVRRRLEERYGQMENCTVAQIEATAKDLRVAKARYPYLYAAFLGRAELESLRKLMPQINWTEVEQRIERIYLELPCAELRAEHFHESWWFESEL